MSKISIHKETKQYIHYQSKRKIIKKVFQNLFSSLEECRIKQNILKDSTVFYIFQILRKKKRKIIGFKTLKEKKNNTNLIKKNVIKWKIKFRKIISFESTDRTILFYISFECVSLFLKWDAIEFWLLSFCNLTIWKKKYNYFIMKKINQNI